jgi:hypothetical protein
MTIGFKGDHQTILKRIWFKGNTIKIIEGI